MISNDNLSLLHKSIEALMKPLSRIISYLPTSHIASMSMDVIFAHLCGCCVYFCDIEALKGDLLFYLKSVRPHFFLGVPRVYEKIMAKI